MIKIAVYGKGGIGKSTTISNVCAALAMQGYRVMQIGCDPKADSTMLLRQGQTVPTVLDLMREKKSGLSLPEVVKEGSLGVLLVEAGGSSPPWRLWGSWAPMKYTNLTWSFTTSWVT